MLDVIDRKVQLIETQISEPHSRLELRQQSKQALIQVAVVSGVKALFTYVSFIKILNFGNDMFDILDFQRSNKNIFGEKLVFQEIIRWNHEKNFK